MPVSPPVYSTQQRVKKLKETWEQVTAGEMPPWFYLPAHREARLSAEIAPY